MDVVIDTNLLLLLVVGGTDRSIVTAHKRLARYSYHDFDRLEESLRQYNRYVVLPNTLTETSNLLGYIAEPYATALRGAFRTFVLQTSEVYLASVLAVQDHDYLRLGLTDAAILAALNAQTALLTDDVALYLAAARRGFTAINFAHIRDRPIG